MRQFKMLVGFALAVLYVVSAAFGQRLDPDYAEVYRRGDYVESFGQGPRSDGEQSYLQAMAKPADDSHKWFITIITAQNCGPCKKLLADWQTAPELLAFARFRDQKNSWAHLNVYAAEDETQAWRWTNIKVTSYPTIIIQPPVSGQYGDASTVVLQKAGYNGKPAELAKQMGDQIRTYIAKPHNPSPNVRGAQSSTRYPYFEPNPQGGAKELAPWKGPPPFTPPPKVNPVSPLSPLGPDLNIPDFVNPDKPAVPAPPATPTPSVDDKPVATVVIDGLEAEAVITDTRFQKVLKALRQRHKNLTVEYSELSKNKDKFPTLTKNDLPAIVVSEGGVVREAFTNLLLPLMQEVVAPPSAAEESEGGPIRRAVSKLLQPWLSELPTPSEIAWYVSVFKGLTTYGPWAAGLGGVGLVGFYVARRYRKQQGLPMLVSDDQLEIVKNKILELISKPKTPS